VRAQCTFIDACTLWVVSYNIDALDVFGWTTAISVVGGAFVLIGARGRRALIVDADPILLAAHGVATGAIVIFFGLDALVKVRAGGAVAFISAVAGAAERALVIRARRIHVAVIRICAALINVCAGEPVAREPRVALAIKSTICVAARGVVIAIVGVVGALIHVCA
jgi:hypothetical protein